jgi:hypothetical protein
VKKRPIVVTRCAKGEEVLEGDSCQMWKWKQRNNTHLSSLWHAFTEDFELYISKIGMKRHGHVLYYVCGLRHCLSFEIRMA